MMRSLIRIALVVVPLVAGIAAGFGYEYLQLQKQQKLYVDKLNDTNRKLAAAEKRYTDARTLNISLEGQKKAALEEVEKVRKDGETMAEAVKELKAGVFACEGQNKAAAEQISHRRSELDAARKRFEEAAQVVSEREAEIKRLSAEQQALQSTLKKNQEGLARCEGNNARLCIIAGDILEKYEKKGVFTTIAQNEPFTQLKKVELEKFVQEYSQLIEQEKLKKRDK